MTNWIAKSLSKFLVAFGCLLAPAFAGAQGITVHDIVLNQYGTPMPGSTITICTSQDNVRPLPTPCTHLAPTVYLDSALTVTTTNPFKADGLGNYDFALAPGTYVVSISGVLLTPRSYVLVLALGNGGSVANVDLNILARGTGIGLPLVNSDCTDLADSTTPMGCLGGLNANFSGYYIDKVNDTNVGTTVHKTARIDSNGHATIAVAGTTSRILGIAEFNTGTSGNVSVCWAGNCPVLYDNQSTAGHWAIPSATVDGELHDTNSLTETAGYQNFLVSGANTGADTLGYVSLMSPDSIGSGAGGFVNPMTTACDMIVAIAGGVPTRLPCPEATGTVGVDYILAVTGGATGAGQQYKRVGVVPRFVTITTDAILKGDRANIVRYTNSGSIAVSLTQAGGTEAAGFDSNFFTCLDNVNGTLTVTPSTSTINGAATAVIPLNTRGCIYSDNTNYYITYSSIPTASQLRRTCMLVVGADNGLALTNSDLGPQGRQCFVPSSGTINEITVAGDAGTPNVIVGRNRAGSIVNLVSSALATAASGGLACSKTTATTGLDGATTCAATLQNTTLNAGDWLELVSGTAGGTAKRMSIAVTFTLN